MIEWKKSEALDEAMKKLLESLLEVREYLDEVTPFNGEILTPAREKQLKGILLSHELPSAIRQDPSILKDNPYFRDIRLDQVRSPSVWYEKAVIKKRTVLNTDFLRPVGAYLFHEHPLGYFDEDLEIPVLKEKGKVWMSPVVSEIQSMGDGVKKGWGRCMTMGLGLGFLPYLWLLKDEVKSVTVVERNPHVIELFNTYIRPQFPSEKELTILCGDALDFYNESFLSQFDYSYVDFWESTEDGLAAYIKLQEKKVFAPRVDFWIEDAILQDVKHVVALYLLNHYRGSRITDFIAGQEGLMQTVAKKANRFFKNRQDVLSTEEELLFLLHDKETLRALLSLTR